jgi:dCMP deaminase
MKNGDRHFLRMAELVAQPSKDPSTKTGAVFVDPTGRVVSTGYNGFPRRMPDDPTLLADREQKYSRIVHCEMNALIFARENLEGCTLYTWPFMSCDRCVVHMLQAGIQRFVAPVCPPEQATRWAPVFERTRRYIGECGCSLEEIEL